MEECRRCKGEKTIYHKMPHDLFVRMGKECNITDPHEHKVQFACPSCDEHNLDPDIDIGVVVTQFFEEIPSPVVVNAKLEKLWLDEAALKSTIKKLETELSQKEDELRHVKHELEELIATGEKATRVRCPIRVLYSTRIMSPNGRQTNF
jgi:hypothetical protein